MMQPLDLNLASRPFKNNTLPWTLYGLGAALMIVFTVWNVTTLKRHMSLLAQEQGRISSIDSELRELETRNHKANVGIRQYDLATLGLQAQKANEVIAWKAFSWTRLFNHLERVQPWNVRMSSVRPLFRERGRGNPTSENAVRRSVPVAVEGIAKDFKALRSFQDRLIEDPNFEPPEPERLDRRDSGEIVFTMTFNYFLVPADEPPQAQEAPEAETVAEAEPEGPPAEPAAQGENVPAVPADPSQPTEGGEGPAEQPTADEQGPAEPAEAEADEPAPEPENKVVPETPPQPRGKGKP